MAHAVSHPDGIGIWTAIFVVSSLILIVWAVRSATVRRWIGHVLLNIALAGVLIYLFNVLELIEGISIPINFVTMAWIAILGMPGALALISLKWFVI